MKRGHVAVVLSVLLLVGAWVAVTATRGAASAPVSVRAAHLSGDVWVMPERQVAGFLREHGVPDPSANPYPSGTAVVGRVSWASHTGGPGDRFTILLGDAHGGAGRIEWTSGPRVGEVSMGNGSMWNATTARHAWLKGDGPLRDQSGVTSLGQFASYPTDWAGDAWFVGRVLDASEPGTPTAVADPKPVLGVALSTEDRVWWLQRVASA